MVWFSIFISKVILGYGLKLKTNITTEVNTPDRRTRTYNTVELKPHGQQLRFYYMSYPRY